MLDNKGFAVSAVLYTLLIAFLLFLGATLAMFSSSNSTVGNSNNDLIDGSDFRAQQVKTGIVSGKGTCVASGTNKIGENDYYWYESKNDILVRINSRYGTMYWPRDFGLKINNGVIEGTSKNNKNIAVSCLDKNGNSISCSGIDLKNKQETQEPEPIIDVALKSVNISDSERKIEKSLVSSVAFPETVYDNLSNVIGLSSEGSIELYEALAYPSSGVENTVDLNFDGVDDVQCYSKYLDDMIACQNPVSPENSEYADEFEQFESVLSNFGEFEGNIFNYDTVGADGAVTKIKYFPVLYVFNLSEDNWYKDDYNVSTFNKVLYYDLVPSSIATDSSNDGSSVRAAHALVLALWALTHNGYDTSKAYVDDNFNLASGKEFDQVALFNNENRVSPYFFARDELLLGGTTIIPPEKEPSLPKPESYANLLIKDMIANQTYNLSLYDICE